MDARSLVVLLLLVTVGRGQAEGPGATKEGIGDHMLMEEDNGSPPRWDAQTPVSVLQSLLQAMKRPGRSPAFLFQPQRFGRDARRSPGRQGLSLQAGEAPLFWSLAAPQRFGKK